jgi:hypothetical protein
MHELLAEERTERATETASRLRICIVTETYAPEVNGVTLTLGQLVAGLRARGHAVSLVRPRQPRPGSPRSSCASSGTPSSSRPATTRRGCSSATTPATSR